MAPARDAVSNIRRRGMLLRLFLFVCVLISAACTSSQGTLVETHPIGSKTLSDRDFLVGEKEAPEVKIDGVLQIPTARTDRLPLVILLHGSDGIGAHLTEWVGQIHTLGISTLIVDSFTSRGILSLVNDQSRLGRLVQTFDAYRSVELMARHPRIDPERIALMGFSRGGQAALYASLDRFRRAHGPAGIEIAAYIAFYPTCNTIFLKDEMVADKPIRIFHGTNDDYAPIEPCHEYVARLRKAGRDVQLFDYHDAHHAFDFVHLKFPLKLSEAQTVRDCRMEEKIEGVVVNATTGQPFAYNDACVKRGATVAYNEKAHVASVMEVREFLKKIFQLN